MAASTLSKHGINDFLILEATDRVGGRLHEKQFEGYTVEIGANWVEGVGGEKVNPIWTLANDHNLTLSYSDFSNVSANTYSQEWVYYVHYTLFYMINVSAFLAPPYLVIKHLWNNLGYVFLCIWPYLCSRL